MNGYEYKTILTDGISVSICFQKRSGKKYKENKNIDEDNDVCIDEICNEDLELCASDLHNSKSSLHISSIHTSLSSSIFLFSLYFFPLFENKLIHQYHLLVLFYIHNFS